MDEILQMNILEVGFIVGGFVMLHWLISNVDK